MVVNTAFTSQTKVEEKKKISEEEGKNYESKTWWGFFTTVSAVVFAVIATIWLILMIID